MKIVYPREMAEMDKRTIAAGTPGLELMERAGEACFKTIADWTGGVKPPAAVICGGGNNGGDGFVIARKMIASGWQTAVFALAKPEKMSADSRANYEKLVSMGQDVVFLEDDLSPLEKILDKIRFIVDAIFGTGLKDRPLSAFYENLLNLMDHFNGWVAAVDIPSGLRGDCGLPLSAAVHADFTVVIQNYKTGCLLAQGPDYAGTMKLVDIGISENIIDNEKYMIDAQWVTLPHRKKYSHKYDYGNLKIVAGSKGMLGAGVLASAAALKSGAGLVTTCVPQDIYPLMAVKMPSEIMVTPWDPVDFEKDQPDKIYNAVLVGPGIGRNVDYGPLLTHLLGQDTPLVVDADGLWHLAKMTDVLKASDTPVILTPHLGEFSRLTGLSRTEIEANSVEIGTDFAKTYGVTLVLKGYTTLVFDPAGSVYFNSTGNPGMATAGSGDVLAGMITAFLGRGMAPVRAACAGVYYHGKAGDLYAGRYNMESLTASAIIQGISRALK